MWKGNIKMDLKEQRECGLDSCVSRYSPGVSTCIHNNKLSGAIKGRTFLAKHLLAYQEGIHSLELFDKTNMRI
jgi:hypothetical protein